MGKNKIRQLALAGLALTIGAVLAATLILTEPAPAREKLPEILPMVEVINFGANSIVGGGGGGY